MIMDPETDRGPDTRELEKVKRHLDEKDAEIERLKIRNLFWATLFDGIGEEIMVLDRDFNIIDVNRAFLKKHGLDKSEALGKKCYLIKEDSGEPCKIEERFCPLIRCRKTRERVELTHIHGDVSEEIKEHILIMYPLKTEGVSEEFFLEIARDITEYRVLIRKLQASEKRFRAILDTATDAVLSIDENHRIVLFNNAAERIFGYSREEVLGKDLGIIIPPRYGHHQKYVQNFLENRESDIIGRTTSLTAFRKNGEEFPIDLSLSFLEMKGKVTFTAIIRDKTEHQQMESKLLQSERLAAVGQAVAHVAHEIRNPLMIIGGFSNQIRSTLANEKDIQKIDMVLQEVERLERLVTDLGDFTKEYRLVKRPSDINSVLKDVLKIMYEIYPPDRYRFVERLSPGTNEINCDPDKLKQVFINIISNGCEAMADGGTITVSTEKNDSGLEIRITDEGVGIPEKDLNHIFEPFYTTRERGSGLGLSISYKIIEAHDGEISAESSPGRGASFIIRLPHN
jgi:two-component system sensor kinase FixL